MLLGCFSRYSVVREGRPTGHHDDSEGDGSERGLQRIYSVTHRGRLDLSVLWLLGPTHTHTHKHTLYFVLGSSIPDSEPVFMLMCKEQPVCACCCAP